MAPKLKTHKGFAKRVKITATGKLIRKKGGKGHLLSGKSAKQRRRLRQTKTVPSHMARVLKKKFAN